MRAENSTRARMDVIYGEDIHHYRISGAAGAMVRRTGGALMSNSKNPEARKRKRHNQQRNRRARVEHADVSTWHMCSEYHYQKTISGKLVNWWPSRMKCQIDGKIYRVSSESDMHELITAEQRNAS